MSVRSFGEAASLSPRHGSLLDLSPQPRSPFYPLCPSTWVELQVRSPRVCHTVLLLCTGYRDQIPMSPHPPCAQSPKTAGDRGLRDPNQLSHTCFYKWET